MTDVMTMLREGTAELHQRAEHQEFQQRMFRAELKREEYAHWLAQMWHVHRALERGLGAPRASDPRFAAVPDEHAKEPLLAADLEALGAEPSPPLPATARLVARIEESARTEPLRLLGYHYVLEGSANGNRVLARRLLPALGLEPGVAGRYLDPYGERQRETWTKFKDEMRTVELTAAESELLVDAAREMFGAISEISSELSSPSSAVASPAPA